eukprot:gnl/MRDRNA2_/MRDRNA2_141939_c0_seq1.p1 gnl/MRDRNA2_/MRDRNA2_141939_c0~~gnl/MRDRNA2_/MRDRNA2_141939_c0_seq1.p1  ORF type:complete len:600 (+),score=114.82 gnl/MRDRNA2_/MRDRNA2_141939_c0_seq1:71-1870(+)
MKPALALDGKRGVDGNSTSEFAASDAKGGELAADDGSGKNVEDEPGGLGDGLSEDSEKEQKQLATPNSKGKSSPGGHALHKKKQNLKKSLTKQQGSQFFSEADLNKAESQAQMWGADRHEQKVNERKTWLQEQQHLLAIGLETVKFQIAIGVVISVNAVTIGVETDKMASGEEWSIYPLEVAFTIIYSMEIFLKLFAYGCAIFKDIGFWFDLLLVLLAITDTFVLSAIDVSSQLSSFMMLRMLRLFKLGRILRLFKLCREIWLLMSSIIDSMRLLVWSGILLTLLLYLFGIFTTQVIGARLRTDDVWPDEEDRWYLYLRFGSIDRSMYTLFECMVGGDLMETARIVQKGLSWMWVFFVLYTCIALIAILNVIVAIIVENTMKKTLAENEGDKRKEMELRREALRMDLINVFQAADTSGDGMLSRDEWLAVLEAPDIMSHLKHLELNKDQCIHIFDALDIDQNHQLDAMEFLEGVMQGVHATRVYDIMSLHGDLYEARHSIEKELASMRNQPNGDVADTHAQGGMARVETRIDGLERRLDEHAASHAAAIERIELQQASCFERIQSNLNVLLATRSESKGLCASYFPRPPTTVPDNVTWS